MSYIVIDHHPRGEDFESGPYETIEEARKEAQDQWDMLTPEERNQERRASNEIDRRYIEVVRRDDAENCDGDWDTGIVFGRRSE